MPLNMTPEHIEAREKYFAERREKIKAGKKSTSDWQYITIDDIARFLIKFDGDVSAAADYLGVSRSGLRRKINDNEVLRNIHEELKESFVDVVENKFKQLCRDGNVTAIIFALKTMGKKRGYVERTTVEHEIGPDAAKSSAALIEEMRKGAQQQAELEADIIEVKAGEIKWLESKQEAQQDIPL